jgi:hypothetical protein
MQVSGYVKLLKQFASQERAGISSPRYPSAAKNRDPETKAVLQALAQRKQAVSSVDWRKKAAHYTKSANIFKMAGAKSPFLKTLFFENSAFAKIVYASNSSSIKIRLKYYSEAIRGFSTAQRLAKRYGLEESEKLNAAWIHLASAMMHENRFYLRQEEGELEMVIKHSRKARTGFQELRVKKLYQLSTSLGKYAQALLARQEYESAGKLARMREAVRLLREASGSITVAEFLAIKAFYSDLAKKYATVIT